MGAFITVVSVFFNAITQNVLGTYVSMQNGESLDLVAGRVPRSEYFNLSDQPPDSELTLRMHDHEFPYNGDSFAHMIREPIQH